jgi:ribonuclease E
MKAPPRLLDDPTLAPELRSDLERTAAAPSGYDMATGLAGFQAAIAASLAAPAGGGAGAHASATASAGHAAGAAKAAGVLGSAGAKLAIAGLGTAAVMAAAVAGWTSRPQTPTTPSAATVQRVAAPSVPSGAAAEALPTPIAEDQPTSAAEPAGAPEPALAQEPQHALAPARSVAIKPRALGTAQDPLRAEIAQLGQIKTLLASDPASAYRLARAGNRQFRHGILGQERDALAALALWNLGRHAEAKSAAQTFASRYPDSPLRERLQPMLQSQAK